MRIRALFFIALALVLAQTSFGGMVAGSGGTISSCTNWPGSPITEPPPPDPLGVLYTQFTCSLYGDVSSYTFGLTPLLTQDGADLAVNAIGAGYLIVIAGDPNVVSNNDANEAALYNQGLWRTVLFFPGDLGLGTDGLYHTSDTLTVYWPAAFSLIADNVQTYDENLYGTGSDSEFFIKATPPETVYTPDPNEYEYDIYSIPEPGTIALLGFGLALLGGAVLKRRRTAGRAA
jgi:hypothetical protein